MLPRRLHRRAGERPRGPRRLELDDRVLRPVPGRGLHPGLVRRRAPGPGGRRLVPPGLHDEHRTLGALRGGAGGGRGRDRLEWGADRSALPRHGQDVGAERSRLRPVPAVPGPRTLGDRPAGLPLGLRALDAPDDGVARRLGGHPRLHAQRQRRLPAHRSRAGGAARGPAAGDPHPGPDARAHGPCGRPLGGRRTRARGDRPGDATQ